MQSIRDRRRHPKTQRRPPSRTFRELGRRLPIHCSQGSYAASGFTQRKLRQTIGCPIFGARRPISVSAHALLIVSLPTARGNGRSSPRPFPAPADVLRAVVRHAANVSNVRTLVGSCDLRSEGMLRPKRKWCRKGWVPVRLGAQRSDDDCRCCSWALTRDFPASLVIHY